ncbi:MAG: hypothetical protein WCU88_10105 [Elusimicrobiota bacterium]
MRIVFTTKERELLQSMLIDDSGVTEGLKAAKPRNGKYATDCSLDSLELLINSIAAEANHTKSKKREKDFDELYERLVQIQEKAEHAL